MKLRSSLAALLIACGCGAPESAQPPQRPNIVMIVADDQGYRDFGFMGATQIRTPNIDALARGGVVFPLAYNTASVCRPSLVSLLTGLDPVQWQATVEELERRDPNWRLESQVTGFATLPRILGLHGYASFQSGKFWEGTYRMAGFSDGLKTEFAVGLRDVIAWSGGKRSLAIGRSTMQPLYDFIDAHAEVPFYVWFAPMLPHVPYDAPEEFVQIYADQGLSPHTQAYYANITRLDAAVGQLVAHIEARGLRGRTLFVFLSDNGWEVDDRPAERVWVGGAKGKSSMHELGWRTPLIFNWPGVIPAGETKPTLASSLDLFPTLLGFAGAPPLDNRPGIDLRPVLQGGDPHVRDALFGSDLGVRPRATHFDGRPTGPSAPAYMLRTERWHYVWNTEDDSDALYDILADPDETRDVAAAHAVLVEEFRDRIEAWRKAAEQPVVPALP